MPLAHKLFHKMLVEVPQSFVIFVHKQAVRRQSRVLAGTFCEFLLNLLCKMLQGDAKARRINPSVISGVLA
jgi:hypothetical protein